MLHPTKELVGLRSGREVGEIHLVTTLPRRGEMEMVSNRCLVCANGEYDDASSTPYRDRQKTYLIAGNCGGI